MHESESVFWPTAVFKICIYGTEEKLNADGNHDDNGNNKDNEEHEDYDDDYHQQQKKTMLMMMMMMLTTTTTIITRYHIMKCNHYVLMQMVCGRSNGFPADVDIIIIIIIITMQLGFGTLVST